MFHHLGAFAYRFRFVIILAWVLAAAVLIGTAPSLESVSSTDQRDFLPANAPFAHAQAVFERTFPGEFSASSTVILIDAGAGQTVHAPVIQAYMEDAERWLRSDAAPENVADVASPASNPLFADALISADEQIGLITVALTTPTDAAATTQAVRDIEHWLAANPPQGFAVYQTGEAGLNAQAEESTFTTIDRTLFITVALVIIALLVIYRSPVSPLIPLFVVTVALIASLGLIGHLAQFGVIKVIAQVNALLVVVMYGAGTDYCLFLISRFREEMADRVGVQRATSRTVRLVGETISASAGTIIIAFMAMTFAEIGMFRSAGPMLAVGVAVGLLAGLTLTPALLAVLGNRAFWPGKASHRAHGRLYEVTSKLVSSRPALTIVIIVALMLPLALFGLTRDLSYDFVSELPESIPSVHAYTLLREHMGGGNLFPLSVVVTGRESSQSASEILALAAALHSVPGVVDVRSLNAPLGLDSLQIQDMLRVEGQLRTLVRLADDDQGGAASADIAAAVGGFQTYVETLRTRFPWLATDADFGTIESIVNGGLIALAMRQSDLMDAATRLADTFAARGEGILLPPSADGELFAAFRPIVDSYLAEGSSAYRLDVILDDPLGATAQASVMQIRARLAEYQGPGEAVVSGFPAIFTDLAGIMGRDLLRTVAFIMGGIFLVLMVMLRSVIAPLYLIATVLLSFSFTLGLTSLVFQVGFGVERLSWLLPIFMLVFLIGLGIDYSVFLFGRIKEEVAHHGIHEGVHVAVARTGGIITSAGIILAGTFAGMLTGELAFLAQMGFAVSVGILIDTFVVRTILDPALATFFGKWTWWPGGIPTVAPEHAEDVAVARA